MIFNTWFVWFKSSKTWKILKRHSDLTQDDLDHPTSTVPTVTVFTPASGPCRSPCRAMSAVSWHFPECNDGNSTVGIWYTWYSHDHKQIHTNIIYIYIYIYVLYHRYAYMCRYKKYICIYIYMYVYIYIYIYIMLLWW